MLRREPWRGEALGSSMRVAGVWIRTVGAELIESLRESPDLGVSKLGTIENKLLLDEVDRVLRQGRLESRSRP